jgi:hypothetical protein
MNEKEQLEDSIRIATRQIDELIEKHTTYPSLIMDLENIRRTLNS